MEGAGAEPRAELPSGWDTEPPSPISQQLGDAWVKASRSALLALPGVLTGEANYFINPAPPDFARIRIGRPAPSSFDPRLRS